MIPDIKLDSWEKRSEEHQKQYKYLLQKADKNKVLKLLPEKPYRNVGWIRS